MGMERPVNHAKSQSDQRTLTAKVPANLHADALKLASQRGKNLSSLVRDALAKVVELGVEDALQSRLDGMEKGTHKLLKRVEAAIAIIKSVEDDETQRRRVHEAAIREHLAALGAQIGEVVAANTAILQVLVDAHSAHEEESTKALKGLLQRSTDANKMLLSLLHAANPVARERWRAVESGMRDGKKWAEYAQETFRKV